MVAVPGAYSPNPFHHPMRNRKTDLDDGQQNESDARINDPMAIFHRPIYESET